MTYYLQRLLDRSAPSANLSTLRPSLPIRSPVTEADQRLHDPDLATTLLAAPPALGFDSADFDPFATDTLDDDLLAADLPEPPATQARFRVRSTPVMAPTADNRREGSAFQPSAPGRRYLPIFPPLIDVPPSPDTLAAATGAPHPAAPPQRQTPLPSGPSPRAVAPTSLPAGAELKQETTQPVQALRIPPAGYALPLMPTPARPVLLNTELPESRPAAKPAAPIAPPLLRPVPLAPPEPTAAPIAAPLLAAASAQPPAPIRRVEAAPDTRVSAVPAARRPMPATAEAVSRIGPLTPRRRTHLVFGLRRR